MDSTKLLYTETYNQKTTINQLIHTFLKRGGNPEHITKGTATPLGHDEIFKVDWIIENQLFSLLKEKISKNKYLLFDKNSIESIFKIKDLDLFIQVFNKFEDYYSPRSEILQLAVKHDNFEISKYMFEQKGYLFNLDLSLEYAWRNENYEMVRYLLDSHYDRINFRNGASCINIEHSIQSGDLEMINYILGPKFCDGVKFSNASLIYFHKLAFYTGKYEIFKSIHEKFPLNQADLLALQDWFQVCSCKKGSHELLVYLKEKSFIDEFTYQSFRNIMGIEAFKHQDMDTFNKLNNGECEIQIQTLPISSVKDSFTSFQKVVELVNLKLQITKDCIKNAASKSWDLASLLGNNCVELVNGLVEYYQMDIEPISTNSNITNCSTPPTKNFFNQLLVKDENVDLLNEYLINFSHLLVASDYEEALKLSAHYGTVEIFKLLFTKIYNTTNNNNLMDQFNTIVPPMACSNAKKDLFYNINEIKKYRFSHLYNIAATNSNNGILRYLIEQSIPHDGTVLWKASSLETIDLLRSAGHSLESCLLEANMEFEFELPSHPLFLHLLQCHQLHRYNIDHLILASIKQQKIKQFKYLIDHANIHCHSHVVAIIDNLEMLQYYLEKYPPYIYNSIVDNGYKECFIRSMKLGRLDILKFLIQSFDPTIILLTSIKIKEFKLQLNQCDEYVRVFLQHQVDKNTNPSTMTKKKRKRDRQPHEKRDKEYILFSFLTKI